MIKEEQGLSPQFPITLHPKNPHYFIFREKPTILVTSGEHYGAVINQEFDYEAYLSELHADGLNHSRIFSGVYREVPGNFGIKQNILAPDPKFFVCPWARSEVPGAPDGGNRFDLDQWNVQYFERLKAFCTKAGELGIIIELTLFCPFYECFTEENSAWPMSPLHPMSNVNGTENISANKVHSIKNSETFRRQKAMVKKLVEELNAFDNLFFEICNEPWAEGMEEDWLQAMIDEIVETEKNLTYRHMISHNVHFGYSIIDKPYKEVSIYNYHYASPEAVRLNYGLNKAIGYNETGFAGQADSTYRIQAWEFMMAGGALFNNLDYSFAVGFENGTYKYDEQQPGAGTKELRKQLGVLLNFLNSFDFVFMSSDNSIIRKFGVLNGTAYVLADPGKAYAIYIRGNNEANLELELPAGKYLFEWIHPVDGKVLRQEQHVHNQGLLKLPVMWFQGDIALKILAIEDIVDNQ